MLRRLFLGFIVAFGVSWLAACERDSPTAPGTVCVVSLTPEVADIGREGGTANLVIVASDPTCAWTVLRSVTWVTLLQNFNGPGSTTLRYEVQANPLSEVRTATLTIGNSTHTIRQEGQPPPVCTYLLTPTNASFIDDGGEGTAMVSAGSTCAWTASSNATWVTITSGGQGTGNGTITYRVSPNVDVTSRTATITVQGQTLIVLQEGATTTAARAPSSGMPPAAPLVGMHP